MKRILTFLALATAAGTASAQPALRAAQDSTRMYDLQTIEVTATRASHATPVARTRNLA